MAREPIVEALFIRSRGLRPGFAREEKGGFAASGCRGSWPPILNSAENVSCASWCNADLAATKAFLRCEESGRMVSCERMPVTVRHLCSPRFATNRLEVLQTDIGLQVERRGHGKAGALKGSKKVRRDNRNLQDDLLG
jgi:hypothetical protein